jgi:hypothetical protein
MKGSAYYVICFHHDASTPTPSPSRLTIQTTRHSPQTCSEPKFINRQNVVARLVFFMLRSRYAIFPSMKVIFTTAAGTLYQEARPTAIGQSHMRGTRL